MSNPSAFVFDVPTDKVTGTWSMVGGSVNPLYPLTNLDDGKPWNPTIFTSNPSRIVCAHSGSVRLDSVGFGHSNFPAGYGLVVSRGNVIGTALTTAMVTCAGPTEDDQPSQPFVDLTTKAGYGTYPYTWFDLPVTGTLLTLGHFRLTSTKRQPAIGAQWGLKFREKQPLIKRPTDASTQIGYGRGTRARWISGHIQTTDAGFAELRSAWRACRGGLRPFALMWDPTINDWWWVTWGPMSDAVFEQEMTFLDLNDLELDWEEVGRGLAP